jgi:Flp pilus assembly protein TadD
MIRSIALAAVSGAVVAAAIVYLSRERMWQELPAARSGSPQPVAETEAWPICTTIASLAEADGAQLDPDFAAGKKSLAAGEWNSAIAALKLAALREPRNADIQNYIGYAYRRLRQVESALAHFRQAITFNPRHREAHQHLGESYLAIGDLVEAEAQLAALERICLITCDEYGDLQRAIATYKSGGI